VARSRDGLYRRENNIFAFRYKDVTGSWKEKYTGSSDRKTAKDFRADFIAKLEQGNLPTEMADWTLEEAKKWWLEFRKPRIAQNTITAEGYRLKPMIRILGNVRLKQITNLELDRYTTKRLEEEIGAWSINKEIMAWSMILRKAKLWRRISEDYKPLRTKVSDIGRAITREQLRELAGIAATDKDWEAAFYGSVLAASTGLRGGEIKKLRIGEIDLENRRIRIRRESTKTDAGARVIELNRDAAEAAARLILRASLLKPPATKPEHYLMPKNLSNIKHGANIGQRGYDPHQHQQYWDTAWHTLTNAVRCPKCQKLQDPADKCIVETCGEAMKGLTSSFAGLNFHSLRHSFISHMVELGVPIGLIQSLVGHMSARMVRHYTHISSGAARKAVELLDAQPILGQSPISLEHLKPIEGSIQ
jgi:integrase